MATVNKQTGTRVDEIAAGIYRIHTPVPDVPGGFSFNQYLIVDDDPLLFHTGPRRFHDAVRGAIESLITLTKLRYIAFSHYESDECGSLNALLGGAPRAEPVCSLVNAMINGDTFDRQARQLSDGEAISLGSKTLRWVDTPHLPHAWECGYMFEEKSRTLLCGDLFTQGGSDAPPIKTGDILGPSEEFRVMMDYFSHTRNARSLLSKLATLKPTTLACMHGSAWQGDGAALLGALADAWSP